MSHVTPANEAMHSPSVGLESGEVFIRGIDTGGSAVVLEQQVPALARSVKVWHTSTSVLECGTVHDNPT